MRLAAALGLLLLESTARGGAGTSGADLLKVSAMGSRALAMGGASAALTGDLSGLLSNPSLVSALGGRALQVAHWPGLAGMATEYLSYALPLGSAGTWAGTVLLRQFPDIDNDVAGEEPVAVNDGLLMASFARRAGGGAGHAGLNVKLFNSTVGTVKATSLAFDAGALAQTGGAHPLRYAVAVANAGNPIKLGTAGERLPLAVRGGVSWARPWFPHALTVAADLAFDVEQDWRSAAGAEWVQQGRLALRAGAAAGRFGGASFTLGAGWRLRSSLLGPEAEYVLDYAYVPFALLGGFQSTHAYSLLIKF